MLSLTMAPTEFTALLEAIGGVGARVDDLRADVFRAIEGMRRDHDKRILALEIERERREAVAQVAGERRQTITLQRRWIVTLVGGWVFGITATLLDLLRIVQGGKP